MKFLDYQTLHQAPVASSVRAPHFFGPTLIFLFCWGVLLLPAAAQVHTVSLEELVDPMTVLRNQQEQVPVTLHGFIAFDNLWQSFEHIDREAGRWNFDSPARRQEFAESLLKRVTESRVISMTYNIPYEVLITHTQDQLATALSKVRTAHAPVIFKGKNWSLDAALYRQGFLDLQARWKGSLNCWSAGPSVAERTLSNWYIIREGIELFGATYDSTEHFWQAVKYHPEVGLPDLGLLLDQVQEIRWKPWLDKLANDQPVYFAHTYAIEFLKQNLTSQRLQFFRDEVERYSRSYDVSARQIQQRSTESPWSLRFTALDEKVLWGDLADVLHLIYFFNHLDESRFRTPDQGSLLQALETQHFDGIYLSGYAGGKVPFISPEFRQLMLEIWHVKFLEMDRFREVLLSTGNLRLQHYLNDGDSPDIPIPIYVGFLEEIRRLARQQR